MTAYMPRPVMTLPIYARNAGGQSIDDLSKDLQDRIAKLDKLIETRQNQLTNLPENVRQELEDRTTEINKLAADITQIQTDLVNQAKTRNKEEADTLVGILIRNTEAIEIAQTMLSKRQKNSSVNFDGIKARNIITLGSLGDNAQYAQNDLNRRPWQPLTVVDLITWHRLQTMLLPCCVKPLGA